MPPRGPRAWPRAAGRAAVAALAGLAALPGAAAEDILHKAVGPELAREYTADWRPDDLIEVHYGELLLAQWVLEHSPWNAYHSGLGFLNNRTQQKVLFDYTPENTSSVMNMVLPEVRLKSELKAVLFGEAEFVYHDEAKTQFYNSWPPSYSSMIRLGYINGTIFQRFVDWVIGEYEPRYHSFQPIEVSRSQNSTNGIVTAVRSRMCHDFVTDGLWVLYDAGAKFQVDDIIFRDHIIMYAKALQPSGQQVSSRRAVRRRLRYLRLISFYLEDIKDQFTAARGVLIVVWRLGLHTFLKDQDQDYDVELVPPFLNYCYLPLAIPPQVHNPLGSMKLCALGMQANFSNTTAPWPWGPLLAVEERLDRPETLPSLLLVVLAVLLVPGRRKH